MTGLAWAPPAGRAPISMEAALTALEATDIVAAFHRPRDFDDGNSLPGRVRGALNDVLLRHRDDPPAKVARRRRLFGLPPAVDVLFGEPLVGPDRNGPADAAPSRPFALFAQTDGDIVRVTVRLFGAGRVWSGDVRDALETALTRNGLSVAPLARARARFPDADISEHPVAVDGPVAETSRLRLLIVSLVRLDRAGRLANDAAAILNSAVSRAAGVLAWCGFQLVEDPGWRAAASHRIRLQDSALRPARFPRYTARQGRRLEVVGVLGAATLDGLDRAGAAALHLAQCAGLGSGTTRGLGRFDLVSKGVMPLTP